MDHTTPPPGGIPRHAALDPADCRNPGLLHTPCAASGGRWQDAPPDTTGNAAPLAPAGHRRLGRWRLSRQPNPAACAPVIHHRPERLSRGHDSPLWERPQHCSPTNRDAPAATGPSHRFVPCLGSPLMLSQAKRLPSSQDFIMITTRPAVGNLWRRIASQVRSECRAAAGKGGHHVPC